jgi:hypothetical protein
MHASKGLEFSVVALPGIGQMPAAGEDERRGADLLCGGDAGDAEAGDYGEWGGGVWEKTWNKPIDHGARIND